MKIDPGRTNPKPAQPPARDPDALPTDHADDREGATERDVGDLTGPGAGYDNEPEQDKDRGGVS